MFDADKFPNLLELNLSGNRLNNLSCFGKIHKLKVLDLSGNYIETLISPANTGLTSFHELVHLNLSGNRLVMLEGLRSA